MPPPEVATELVSLAEIRAAAERIQGVARRTPLLPMSLRPPGRSDPVEVWLKCENFQPMGAFKLRGAFNFLSQLGPEQGTGGVVTYSSGNHAQGVAYSARHLGIDCTVVMPTDAPEIKVQATRRLGAAIEQVGTTSLERRRRADEIARDSGAAMVPPFDHPWIIAGAGTTGLEILEQLGRAAGAASSGTGAPLVLVPIGGGGLISGTSAAIKALIPDARIVGVEAERAPKMKLSLEAGEPITIDPPTTLADGLKPLRPGDLTFAHCRSLVDEVVTVSEETLREAVLWCYDRKLVVEPSGAATVGALLAGAVAPQHVGRGPTVAVLSGGNIDPNLLAGWLTEPRGVAE
ncbi:MAG: threonine/serine dehydratase [Gemmatimonadota bacterium]